MLSYKESLKILKETNALQEGHFILSSGLHSDQYVQCAKLLSHPKKAELICSSLCEKIKKNFNKIDIILSPAIGGIVIGYEVGRQLNIETIFAERQEGKLVLRRGFDISKKKDYIEFIFDIQIRDLKNYKNLISELKLKDYKFNIIRHRKKNAFLQRIFKNFKRD